MNRTSHANIQLQGSLMNLLKPSRLHRIQDVVDAFPERRWAEIFEAIEALNQNRRVSFKISGSELELRVFPHRRSWWVS